MLPFPETESDEDNALLSKRVKFLEVLDMEIVKAMNLNLNNGVLYFDHKFLVLQRHVRKIVEVAGNAKVLIRATPRRKNSIWQEVEEASGQKRYARAMPSTIKFIESQVKTGFKSETRICNTGLIYYADLGCVRSLTSEVLKSCVELSQPECQILWAVHAQRAAAWIKVIEWRDPAVADIRWKDPVGAEKFPDGRPGRLRRLWWRMTDLVAE